MRERERERQGNLLALFSFSKSQNKLNTLYFAHVKSLVVDKSNLVNADSALIHFCGGGGEMTWISAITYSMSFFYVYTLTLRICRNSFVEGVCRALGVSILG